MDYPAFNKTVFNLPNAELIYIPEFYSVGIANHYFQTLKNSIPWQQDKITIFGKTHNQPRLTALYANNDLPYSYSSITMQPHPFTKELLQIKRSEEHTSE